MKHTTLALKDKFINLRQWDKTYKALRKHLNTMPVGMPPTVTGVELRLLKAIFSIEEAALALYMDWRFETADEIYDKAGSSLDISREKMENLLAHMDKKGAIYAKNGGGVFKYALHPLVLGMYERQLPVLNLGYYHDLRNYVTQVFGIEYMTSAIPQFRFIPVEKSVSTEHTVSTYDEIRNIIEQAEGEICIADCICRKAKNLAGEPCKVTGRMEICLGFGDFGAMYLRNGLGRAISKKEALEHLDLCEKEGLIIQPTNEKKPEAICLCCSCCCGLIEMMSAFPRPADFVASNFYAALVCHDERLGSFLLYRR